MRVRDKEIDFNDLPQYEECISDYNICSHSRDVVKPAPRLIKEGKIYPKPKGYDKKN